MPGMPTVVAYTSEHGEVFHPECLEHLSPKSGPLTAVFSTDEVPEHWSCDHCLEPILEEE